MTILLFICAFALSGVAAFYSIVGLITIFPAAPVPIAVMASTLELSKIVLTSWLYRNWTETPKLLKTYFVTAIIILMCLTSIGIFGGLSKAHLDQSIVSGDVSSKLALIDEKIKTEKENINAARKTLSQLDSQVESTISRTTDEGGVSRSAALRRSQAKERASLLADIGTAQRNLGKLNEERAPIAAENRKVEAEVGPIKYVAALIYDEKTDETTLEKAVRILILMIVAVFDPLAVLMFIAVNQSYKPKAVTITEAPQPSTVSEVVEPVEIPVTKANTPDTMFEDAQDEHKSAHISSTIFVRDSIKFKLNEKILYNPDDGFV